MTWKVFFDCMQRNRLGGLAAHFHLVLPPPTQLKHVLKWAFVMCRELLQCSGSELTQWLPLTSVFGVQRFQPWSGDEFDHVSQHALPLSLAFSSLLLSTNVTAVKICGLLLDDCPNNPGRRTRGC